jgi:parallel beta-helix repeat protein
MKCIVTAFIVCLILVGVFTFSFEIQRSKATPGTIYIRADGSIDPPTAPISTIDRISYVLTANSNSSIVVQRDNIVLDGAGYELQGIETIDVAGISLYHRENVSIMNMIISQFSPGIFLVNSSGNNIISNNVTRNENGIWVVDFSSHNNLSGNDITANIYDGIQLGCSSQNIVYENNVVGNGWGIFICNSSSYNSIWRNNLTYSPHDGVLFQHGADRNSVFMNRVEGNHCGIRIEYSAGYNNISGNEIIASTSQGINIFDSSSFNSVSENYVENNGYGITVQYNSIGNSIYHNSFMNNTGQASSDSPQNTWSDGYPSGGNYWSDYDGVDNLNNPHQNETGSDGIGDTPHTINGGYQDSFPLMNPWVSGHLERTNVSKGGETYSYIIRSNATILDFQQTPGSIRFEVSGETGAKGYVVIVQPVGLNSSNIKVFLNNTKLTFPSTDPPRSISTNGTHYIIYFSFTFNSAYELTIAFPVEGDVNYDGDVNIFDIVTIAGAYGTEEGQLKYDTHCDLDDDGDIDIFDIVRAAMNYGKSW